MIDISQPPPPITLPLKPKVGRPKGVRNGQGRKHKKPYTATVKDLIVHCNNLVRLGEGMGRIAFEISKTNPPAPSQLEALRDAQQAWTLHLLKLPQTLKERRNWGLRGAPLQHLERRLIKLRDHRSVMFEVQRAHNTALRNHAASLVELVEVAEQALSKLERADFVDSPDATP